MQFIAPILAMALAGCAAQDARPAPSASLPSTALPATAMARAAQVLDAADFHGEALISPSEGVVHRLVHDDFAGGEAWPWASVTKQVMAVATLQQVEAGNLTLDTPIDSLLPPFAWSEATVGDLLRHQSGFRNPEDEPRGPSGFPDFYGPEGQTTGGLCQLEGGPVERGSYTYNNCDYIVLGAFLQRASGELLDTLIARNISDPAGWTGTSLLSADQPRAFASSEPLYPRVLPRFGASGAMVGPLEDMVRFDRALLDGRLLSPASSDILWRADGALGFMALGQWVFDAPLAGCDGPVTIVERRGAIGKYQVRNIILPASGTIVAMATDRGEGDYDFGEIWTGSGLTHDMLSAVACL